MHRPETLGALVGAALLLLVGVACGDGTPAEDGASTVEPITANELRSGQKAGFRHVAELPPE